MIRCARRAGGLGRALFAVYGDGISPDATMTPRFSDGRVAGYDYNGTIAPWATTLYGLYGRSASFGDQPPFDLPQPWRDARDACASRASRRAECASQSHGGC